MNYRHGFHAGNFADVLKHVVLMRVLTHLNAKETPYRVVDTHAGAGRYDLGSDEALRTHEWKDGVARIDRSPLAPAVEALLKPWRDAVSGARALYGPEAYPGSPWLCRHAMRPDDRLIAAELHPPTHKKLVQAICRDERCKALAIDGWNALRGNVPPKERRGLVLIDPPFEEKDEFATLEAELIAAHRKWPTGIYALWYPVKDKLAVANLLAGINQAGIGRLLRLEIDVDRPDAAGGLSATGMLIVNPPWRLAEEARILLPALTERLAQGPQPRYLCEPIRPDG
ncbi:MAG TPA: 23S rRNA (adenine(2030)-N(6))-methyltransferase RlmJ [Bosea sp. (in: a-proteobacteria)]|jgi:23S rRNA (adenine2030-N6)-methyltransferase|uniref:23S rRNA (adenine(2030)-N(6))-methyltransferase RlmJ n=1 Tax=Bosea sp. (in: a-proteobacteria) TaxID=1871050 RepID=UPI002DDD90FA|nr:23S rRNA (adenine(2030)-N(6))-methyltransferase RlmJ [Bosea sp. (in: a-proteobacteria)]HEV2552879.1 23S rRNA (adenine(2030)-N(6))-methyltransferase RlmJ [Bosea sp. (in: a-proteobacteria)]